jgi:hypothetical protein
MSLIDASSARSGTERRVRDGINQLRGINCREPLADIPRKEREEDRVDSARAAKELGKQTMKGVLLIPAAVAVILVVLYLVTRGDDEGDDRGMLGVLIDLLRWW